MKNSRRFKLLLAVLLLAASLFCTQGAWAKEPVVQDLSGNPVTISNYRGKPVILFFWTTWCPFCRKEMKKLNQMAGSIRAQGIVVIGVNVKENQAKLNKFFKDYRLEFPMLLDQNARLADEYDVLGVPTYVFLDKDGHLLRSAHELPDNYQKILSR